MEAVRVCGSRNRRGYESTRRKAAAREEQNTHRGGRTHLLLQALLGVLGALAGGRRDEALAVAALQQHDAGGTHAGLRVVVEQHVLEQSGASERLVRAIHEQRHGTHIFFLYIFLGLFRDFPDHIFVNVHDFD